MRSLLLQKKSDLKPAYLVSDVSQEPDGWMVLVVDGNQTDFSTYFGVNVSFNTDKQFQNFTTADAISENQSQTDSEKIIELATEAIKDDSHSVTGSKMAKLNAAARNEVVGLNNDLRELYHKAKKTLEMIEDKDERRHFNDEVMAKIADAFASTKMLY